MTQSVPRNDGAAVAGLAAGWSIRDAAKAGGLSEKTLQRRLRDPGFRLIVARARGELLAAAVGQLSAAAGDAARALRELLGSDNESVRLSAARSVLDMSVKLTTAVELEERVRALEGESPWESKPDFQSSKGIVA